MRVNQCHPYGDDAESIVVLLAACRSALMVLVCLQYFCLTVLFCDK